MNLYVTIGRVFLGSCLIGMGILHFFFPGIRPIIVPDATLLPAQLKWTIYLTEILLLGSGILILAGKQLTAVSLTVGAGFLLLFFFVHLPSFLSAVKMEKLKYWTNLNKALALSGGFFILASVDVGKTGLSKFISFVNKLSLAGMYFFAIMLLLFGIGHLLSTTAISALVPEYIPFKKFWTFLGGIILVGSAVSIFIRFKVKTTSLLLAGTLLIWLITLHLYYTFRFPNWQEGENFIGSLTCLAFCGTALLISQRGKMGPSKAGPGIV